MSLDLNAIKERREAAFEWVFAMCKGETRFKMSIPYEETDTDAILCAALRDSENLAAEVEKLREASGEGDDLTTAYMVGLEEGKDRARDEAAELKAAIKEYVEATDAYYGGGQIGSAAAWHHLMDKRDALRRLAGGVNDE